MTEDEAINALDAIKPGDPEAAHAVADGVVLGVVAPAVADAYRRAAERVGAWWYA